MLRLALALVLILTSPLHALAEEDARSDLWPAIPKATGEPHPEGNEFWRQNHMNLLTHDRDLTVREGERQIEASLKGCFECHAATDSAGTIVTYDDQNHFCRVCHDYVAVKVDCFTCHRSTPEGVDEEALRNEAGLLPWLRGAGPGVAAEAAGIEGYLAGLAAAPPKTAEAMR